MLFCRKFEIFENEDVWTVYYKNNLIIGVKGVSVGLAYTGNFIPSQKGTPTPYYFIADTKNELI